MIGPCYVMHLNRRVHLVTLQGRPVTFYVFYKVTRHNTSSEYPLTLTRVPKPTVSGAVSTMSSPVDGAGSDSPKRPRGRPRKEFVEKENLSKMAHSNFSNDVSRRFLQKMAVLNVYIFLQAPPIIS